MPDFVNELLSARKLIKKADKMLENIMETVKTADMEIVVKQIMKYEALSEKICNQARLLPVLTGSPSVCKEVEENIITENNVKVEFLNTGWFHVSIPFLLPKKETGNPTFIRTTIMLGLQHFFADKTYDKFSEPCVIIFHHVYSKEREYGRYRDHDNIELNAVVDAIALYVLKDDMPLKCSHYYFTTTSDTNKDSTEVYVVPEMQFMDFLNFVKGDDSNGKTQNRANL